MSLRIYNTLTRVTGCLQPIEPGHVRMYVCGITVYDLCHIGHARSMPWPSTWYAALAARPAAMRVTYVRNITDIDDKIIRRALDNGEPIRSADRSHDRRACTATSTPWAFERHPRTSRAPPTTCRRCWPSSTLQQRGLAYQRAGR
jgi:cysteinyl-tRNA synthetase